MKKGQISIFVLITLIVFMVILGLFLGNIKNLQKIKTATKNKYNIKKQTQLDAIVNSMKKMTIKGANSGPFIIPSDMNLEAHYEEHIL